MGCLCSGQNFRLYWTLIIWIIMVFPVGLSAPCVRGFFRHIESWWCIYASVNWICMALGISLSFVWYQSISCTLYRYYQSDPIWKSSMGTSIKKKKSIKRMHSFLPAECEPFCWRLNVLNNLHLAEWWGCFVTVCPGGCDGGSQLHRKWTGLLWTATHS